MTESEREEAAESLSAAFVERVKIQSYRSIDRCDVALSPLTLLVGRNASGKSNFLDALHFVADCLQTTVDHALKLRGGIDQVRRISYGHPRNFLIELQLSFDQFRATYGFEIGSEKSGGFSIRQEKLRVADLEQNREDRYLRSGKEVFGSRKNLPPAVEDRLYLVTASGFQEFLPVFDALTAMGFYNFNPNAMKELVSPDSGEILHEDGSNIASVVARLKSDEPQVFERICDYLSHIIPGITSVERVSLGPKETLQFRQEIAGSKDPWRFYAQNMSDGTLRVLGGLVAVTQLADRSASVRLVGIEEPETALHPAAAGALMSALEEAGDTQILITTHSANLLDEADLKSDRVSLLVVQAREGKTQIGAVNSASAEAIRQHLYSAGELLRMDQLEADREDIARQSQMRLKLS